MTCVVHYEQITTAWTVVTEDEVVDSPPELYLGFSFVVQDLDPAVETVAFTE